MRVIARRWRKKIELGLLNPGDVFFLNGFAYMKLDVNQLSVDDAGLSAVDLIHGITASITANTEVEKVEGGFFAEDG